MYCKISCVCFYDIFLCVHDSRKYFEIQTTRVPNVLSFLNRYTNLLQIMMFNFLLLHLGKKL